MIFRLVPFLYLMVVFLPRQTVSSFPSLWNIVETLQKNQFVDLTHSFGPSIPHWKGFDPEVRTALYYYDEGVGTKGDGFFIQKYELVGQWGTHVDPPAHFIKGRRTIDEIDVKEMVLPLVLFNVSEKVRANPDYCITMDDVYAWEEKFGTKVPAGAFAVLRTDWSKRWPDMNALQNKDANGVAHYPGWSLEVLKYLYEERNITASGHETLDTDPGIATTNDDYSLEAYILEKNHYQIECLTNLDKVPEFGSIAVVTFPKPKRGSGFPARVFAIIPSAQTVKEKLKVSKFHKIPMEVSSSLPKITLFGGTNGVGKECLKQALAKGHQVTVLARNPSKIADISSEKLKVIQGDVLDPEKVSMALESSSVVLNSLGSTALKGPGVDICSKGTEVILEGMKKQGIKKIITCSSIGTGDSWSKSSLFTKFFVWAVISKPIADKEIQEDMIKKSGLDYVIVRPTGLITKNFTGKYRVGFDISGGRVARADVAHWMVNQISSDEWLGKCPSITGN